MVSIDSVEPLMQVKAIDVGNEMGENQLFTHDTLWPQQLEYQ